MKLSIIIICLIISANCFSQNVHNSLTKHYVANTSSPTLYCGVGLELLIYRKQDKSFEKKYKLKYNLVGCVQIYSIEIMTLHNKAISNYLDREFGLKWRDSLRPDVFGISK